MSNLPPDGLASPVPTEWGSPVAPGRGGEPAASLAQSRAGSQQSPARVVATVAVAAIIAAVVLGGIGLDSAIAAPSAGIVTVGDSVTMTAAPGWILSAPQTDPAGGIELRKADAILTAQIVSSGYSGSSESFLADQQKSLSGDSAQISFGTPHTTSIGGHDTSYVVFEASVMSKHGSGIVDGELVCMLVAGDAVVVMVDAPQGDLDPVIDDVSAMLASLGAAR